MGIDAKFKFTGSHPIHGYPISEENAIVFLARDAALVDTLKTYRDVSGKMGACTDHMEGVNALIKRVQAFQASEGSVVPGLKPAARLNEPAEEEAPPTEPPDSPEEEPTEETPTEEAPTEETSDQEESKDSEPSPPVRRGRTR